MIKQYTRKGFTLVELIVASSVFSILVLVSSGPFVSMMDFRRDSANQADISDNLKIIVSVLDKEVRTAKASASTFTVSADKRTVSFDNQFGERITYVYNPTAKKISKTVSSPSPETFDITTPDTLYIQSVTFSIDGLNTNEPPVFTFFVIASSDSGGTQNVVTVQNTTLLRNRAP